MTHSAFVRLGVLLFFCLGVCIACQSDQSTATTASAIPQTSPPLLLRSFRYTAADQQLINRIGTNLGQPIQVDLVNPAVFEREDSLPSGGGVDVYWLPNLSAAQQLAAANLLDTAKVEGMAPGRVPPKYGSASGYWTALSYWTPAVLSKRGSPLSERLQTYDQLAKANLSTPIHIGPPESVGLVGLVAALIVERGPAAATRWVEGFAANCKIETENDLSRIQRVLDGSIELAWINSSALTRFKRSGNPDYFQQANELAIVHPADAETGRSYLNATIAAVAVNSDQRGVARNAFRQFFSQNIQQELAESAFEYPVESFTSSSDFLFEFAVPQFSILELNAIAEQIPEARRLVRAAFSLN